jgi:hypothetical protein
VVKADVVKANMVKANMPKANMPLGKWRNRNRRLYNEKIHFYQEDSSILFHHVSLPFIFFFIHSPGRGGTIRQDSRHPFSS